MQLVRAHFARDDHAFASAAMALARGAKVDALRMQITSAVRAGFRPNGGARGAEQMQQLPPSAAANSKMLQTLPRTTFEDLLLPVDIQAQLDEYVLELEYRQELAQRGLRARNRFLFHGPPGNGKTISSAALANALGQQAYVVSIPEVGSMYLNQSERNLAELFGAITDGTVVVFDEIDAIGSRRGDGNSSAGKSMNSVVNTVLTLLDRQRSGVIVATTNRPDIIDPALLRRFDEQVLFPAPSSEQKRALALKLCARHEIAEVDVSLCANFDEVSKRVATEARRIVMTELLAAESSEDEDQGESDELN
jgi:SpoVK/Ycf46/Vps4 family AAA+-type ATPase